MFTQSEAFMFLVVLWVGISRIVYTTKIFEIEGLPHRKMIFSNAMQSMLLGMAILLIVGIFSLRVFL